MKQNGGWFLKGHITKYWLGKHLSKEHKKNISLGSAHLAYWQGGKSFEPYGYDFNNHLKERIRMRDNYRCQQCFRHQSELRGKYNKRYKLLVHHIDYNKQNNKPKNLISLCRACHMQTNYNRNDWTSYFKDKLNG
jgi:hypothetical protein